MKKTFKGWLPKGGQKDIGRAVTLTDLGHVFLEASSSPGKQWFETYELPPVKVKVTVEVENGD